MLGNESQDPIYTVCHSAYGVSSKLVEEASYEYMAIPLDPLPGRPLPPPQVSGPTSASQMNEYENTNAYENTNRRAVISVQARSTAPSHNPPQELGATAMPTTIPVTWKRKI